MSWTGSMEDRRRGPRRRALGCGRTRPILGLVVAWALVGCAHAPEEEPLALPVDPFPRWVAALQKGETRAEEVKARFGTPLERTPSPRGGWIWRYAHAEIHWPDADPMRPVVSAEGEWGPPEPGFWARIGRAYRRTLGWIDRAFYFPPRQSRPPRRRRLPATIHALELHFGLEGTLRAVRYLPHEGMAHVPISG